MREMTAMDRLLVHIEDLENATDQADADGDTYLERACRTCAGVLRIVVEDTDLMVADQWVEFLRNYEGAACLHATLRSEPEAMRVAYVAREARSYLVDALESVR